MTYLFETITLPYHHDERGTLVYGETNRHIPFTVERVFYITEVKKNGKRGFHAHKATRLALFCIKGSSLIRFDNGQVQTSYTIDQPHQGVLIEPMIWHSMENFAAGTILLALSSLPYDETDYIRDFAQFKAMICN